MNEAPEREASAKIAQHLAVAVQVAEAVIRLRQQATDVRATSTQQAAAAARAERTAQHAADRVVWSPALEDDCIRHADLPDLGRVWGAAAGWADTDPTAEVAARRVETRLSDMAPAAMARFDELRESGTDRITAMRDVLANVAAETGQHRRVFVADTAPTATADDGRTRADTAGTEAQIPDDRSTAPVAERAQPGDADTARTVRRTTDAGNPHPADVAADSHPRPVIDITPAATRTKPGATAASTAIRANTRTLTR